MAKKISLIKGFSLLIYMLSSKLDLWSEASWLRILKFRILISFIQELWQVFLMAQSSGVPKGRLVRKANPTCCWMVKTRKF